MASHHHHHRHHQSPPPPPPPPPTHCCCTPSYTCCTPQNPHLSPQHDHLVQSIYSLILSQHLHPSPQHDNNLVHDHLRPTQIHHDNLVHPKSHPLQNHKHQSTISSLLHRIESLESSLNHHHQTHHQSLRHSAATIIQTHFRSFLVRRSRTLRNLKHLASIKSSFISLRSSFSKQTHFDFPALSQKAVNLFIQLDSIQDCDKMIVDGKRSISRDLVQFLDSIEEVAVKKRILHVKAVKTSRSGEKIQRRRNSDGDDEKEKLLKNLRGRVEKISKLCKVYVDDEERLENEEGVCDHDDDGDYDEDGVRDSNKKGFVVKRQEIQPRTKKSVRFAENGKICEVYSTSGESDGSSSNDEHGEVLENGKFAAVVDVVDSSRGGDDEEDVLVEDSGGSTHSSDDGDVVKEKLLFSPPLPLKMENRSELKSKGVKILS
ncbi:BAG family molecular chaperone regulator 8, chloroplastic [Vicia villosa]|uniref:BAG family molecular chaperone regulator 8, chloroplastic n=1 Tax=Vicia villosa TaxID=3911 RepID=UPI00273C250B|nr:BAG family molecular chaperone regulator 8, chloroplastic [Vicia villosa]